MTNRDLARELRPLYEGVFTSTDYARLGLIVNKYKEKDINLALLQLKCTKKSIYQDNIISFFQGILSRKANKENVQELLKDL